jgi:2-amino-4-hydroxy-6-hydroxymethyldihydropteridine diphosphokinase
VSPAEASRDGGARVAAYLALGSNLGERLDTLRRAVDELDDMGGIDVVRTSSVFETDPVGPPQPDFLNVVVSIQTTLEPRALLDAVRSIEQRLGRVRHERWGPRTIDIDILTYDRLVLDEPDLQVPHPRMHERAFVLVPLGELDADPPLPGGRRLAEIELPPGDVLGVRRFAPPLSVGG